MLYATPKTTKSIERTLTLDSTKGVTDKATGYVMKRFRPQKTTTKKKKKRLPVTKDKLSELLVPGIFDPIYKEGVKKGAKKQFNERYG